MKRGWRKAGLALASMWRRFAQFLLSPFLWLILAWVGGVVAIVVGVRMLSGDGYAFIVSGVFGLLTAAFIRKGIASV